MLFERFLFTYPESVALPLVPQRFLEQDLPLNPYPLLRLPLFMLLLPHPQARKFYFKPAVALTVIVVVVVVLMLVLEGILLQTSKELGHTLPLTVGRPFPYILRFHCLKQYVFNPS